MTLSNINIVVPLATSNALSTLYHKNSADRDSLNVNNVEMNCPNNVRLYYESSSVAMFAASHSQSSQYLSYQSLVLHCQLCRGGKYTLKSGSIVLNVPEPAYGHLKKEVVKYQVHNYTDIKCAVCPFGGICNGTLKAKPNYWGMEQDGAVRLYRCPSSYCCSESCSTYNECAANRGGTLCGRCLPGYTEAMFSTKCMPSEKCNDKWFLIIIAFFILSYTCFLLFQNELKLFLVGKPIGTRTLVNKIKQKKVDLAQDGEQSKEESSDTDEGGVFLILLFYYFQDASIIHFDPIHKDNVPELEIIIRKIVYGLFKFQIDVLHLAKTICIFKDVTPVGKLILNLFIVPLFWIVLLIIYVILRVREKRKQVAPIWYARCATALMLSLLLSYQKLLFAVFDTIYCVNVWDKQVLFLDGTIECLTAVQWFVIAKASLCIIPFAVYLTFAPGLLDQGKISTTEFLIGCIAPWFMALYIICFKKNEREAKNMSSSPAKALHILLQGPYKPLKVPGTQVAICWSGILLYRRLALIITHILIHDPLSRLSVMFLICLMSQLSHVVVQPCKEKRANLAGTVSCTALLTIAAINMAKALLESMEIVPTGRTLSIMSTSESVEDGLLVWIPLAGICIILLVLLIRGFMALWSFKLKKHQITPIQTKKQVT